MISRRRWWSGVVALCVAAVHAPVAEATAVEPTLQRVAGTIGEGVATSVGQRPTGLAIHGSTLYVSDGDGTNVVRALDLTTGRQRIVAGNGAGARLDNVPATDTMIYEPHAVTTDAAGNLYILEGGTVRKVGPAGTISTYAGQFTYKQFDGNGDGGPAGCGRGAGTRSASWGRAGLRTAPCPSSCWG